MIRVIKNNRPIGKPWLVVNGYYAPHARWKAADGQKWETTLVVSEHDTRAQAEAALPQHDAHVAAFNREMDWRCDQKLLGNGIEIIAECGTRMGGE